MLLRLRLVPLALLLTGPLFTQGIWEPRQRYPYAAWGLAGAALSGKLYVVGGTGGTGRELHIYDPVRDSWSRGADAPIALVYANAAAAGGKLYILGGVRTFMGTDVVVDGGTYEYDPTQDQWQRVAEMPTPRAASGVAAIGTKIYVAGGRVGRGVVADFDVFDTVTRQWSPLPPLSSRRAHVTAQEVKGRLYAIGGRDAPFNAPGADLNLVEEFDTAANAWRPRAPIPFPYVELLLTSGVLNGRIIIFGQCCTGSYEYDPVGDAWRRLALMGVPRYDTIALTLGSRIFVPGGEASDFSNRPSDVHEVFFFPPSEKPRFPAKGVVQAASFEPALSPGSLVSLFGEALALDEGIASRLPLPPALASVSVRAAGRTLPLVYVGPGEINFHLPYDLPPGPLTLTVVNATVESDPVSLPALVESAPGLFSLDSSGRGQGAILIGNTGLIARPARDASSRPARRGDVVEIYATGLGRVDTPPEAGQPAPSPPARTLVTPLVTVGGVAATVLFSGLAPGQVGVYQINVEVPATSPTGSAVAVEVRMGETGRRSNTVTMAVVE